MICKRVQGSLDVDIKQLFNAKKIYPKDEEAQLSAETAQSLA